RPRRTFAGTAHSGRVAELLMADPLCHRAGDSKRRPRRWRARVRDVYENRIKALARRGHGPAVIARRLGLEAYRERTMSRWTEVTARCGPHESVFPAWRKGKRVTSDYTLNKVEGFLSGELA
ncbi:MAG TPA: hypothetical protein VGD78_09710, partial [Chthoniobacterales bacterium]